MDGAMAQTNRSGDASEPTDGLSRREHDIPSFERDWWKYAGAKEEAIRERFAPVGDPLLPGGTQCARRPARSPGGRPDAGQATAPGCGPAARCVPRRLGSDIT